MAEGLEVKGSVTELGPEADLGESDDDILKCPICFEIFNKPKYLPCLHTFCEACLGSYIVSSVKQKLESKNNETEPKPKVDFSCPICRVVVPVSDQSLPPEEWASTFATNHLILTLLDKQKLQKNIKLCDPCQMDSDDVIAKSWCKVCNEALCELCSKCHRKFVATKQHKLFSIAEKEKTDFDITRYEYCEAHKDKQLEAFCFDHDQACCVSCVTIDHRKCDHVTTLKDAAKDVLDKPEIKELMEVLAETEKLWSKMLDMAKANKSEVQTQKRKMMTRISELRARINAHLDEIQSKLEQDVRDSEKKHVTELNEIVFDLENRQKRVMHYRNVLGTVSTKATAVHVFLEMKKLKKKREEIDSYLKSALKDIQVVDCYVKISTELEKGIFDIGVFGTVGVQRKTVSESLITSVDFPVLNKTLKQNLFSMLNTFSILNANIKEAAFLADRRLAVTSKGRVHFIDDDGKNGTILLIDDCGSLYGVEVLDKSRVLVSLPYYDSVHFVNFQNEKHINYIRPFKSVKGITLLENQIIAMACESRLIFADLQGKIQKEINVQSPVENITSYNGKLFYTNNKTNTLYGITVDGAKLFEYQHPDLKRPYGVTTNEDGYIFVVGYESSNVHQVSPAGEHVNIILTEKNDIKNPHAICYDKKNRKLLLTHSDHKINVYKRAW